MPDICRFGHKGTVAPANFVERPWRTSCPICGCILDRDPSNTTREPCSQECREAFAKEKTRVLPRVRP